MRIILNRRESFRKQQMLRKRRQHSPRQHSPVAVVRPRPVMRGRRWSPIKYEPYSPAFRPVTPPSTVPAIPMDDNGREDEKIRSPASPPPVEEIRSPASPPLQTPLRQQEERSAKSPADSSDDEEEEATTSIAPSSEVCRKVVLNGETLDESPESYNDWMKRRRQAALLNLQELQRLRKEAEERKTC